ncbi:hypothetical protein F52700_9306 [Fusarium sp. NRRL 52700]|nr:hypothetical protein F52700_9306 [Fusarium sp. NRRL 52700]
MYSSLFFMTGLLSLVFPSVSAASSDKSIRGLPENHQIGRIGFVDLDSNLTKRNDYPDFCYVSTMGKGVWWYIPVYAGDENYACIMGHAGVGAGSAPGSRCPGEQWWPADYVEDIIDAGQEQLTKDGGGKRSKKGLFEARFEGITTAVRDRGGMGAILDALFRYELPNCDFSGYTCKVMDRHYFYNYKGDSIGIVHKNTDCRGFLGFGGDTYEYCPGRGHCED